MKANSKGNLEVDMKYEKSQTGWFMVGIFLLIFIHLTIAYYFQLGNKPLSTTAFATLVVVFIIILLCFYRLKICVDDVGIHIIYGIGLIRIKIAPTKVVQVKIVRNPWYFGWGIRFTNKGMLYNIQGSSAVEISYIDGKNKTVRIGTDDPLALKEFLERKYEIDQNRTDTFFNN